MCKTFHELSNVNLKKSKVNKDKRKSKTNKLNRLYLNNRWRINISYEISVHSSCFTNKFHTNT